MIIKVVCTLLFILAFVQASLVSFLKFFLKILFDVSHRTFYCSSRS